MRRVSLTDGRNTLLASGFTNPRGLAIESGGQTALVTDDTGVWRANLTTGSITKLASIGGIGGIVLEPGNQSAVFPVRDTYLVYRINLIDNSVSQVTTTFPPGNPGSATPGAIAIASDGSTAYFSAGIAAGISRINLVTGAVDQTFFIPPGSIVLGGYSMIDFALSSDDSRILFSWLTPGGPKISVITLSTVPNGCCGMYSSLDDITTGLSPTTVLAESASTTIVASGPFFSSLYRLDLATGAPTLIGGGFVGPDIARIPNTSDVVISSGRLGSGGGSIWKGNLDTGNFTQIKDLVDAPFGIATDGVVAYVSTLTAIQELALTTGAMTTIASGLDFPMGLSFVDTNTLVVGSQGFTHGVWKLDIPTGTITTLATFPNAPHFVEVEPDHTTALVSEIGVGITRVNLTTKATTTIYQDPNVSGKIAIEPGGETTFVIVSTGNGNTLKRVRIRAAGEIGTSQPRGEVFQWFPGQPDPTRPTIVITHGWQREAGYTGQPPSWVTDMRLAIQNRNLNHYNILLVVWPEAFTGGFLVNCQEPQLLQSSLALFAGCYVSALLKASSFTTGYGHKLAQYLKSTLPIGYSNAIHLIGHSFGTAINAVAMNDLAKAGINVNQVTLLDAPMLVPNVPDVSLIPIFYTADWFQQEMPYLSTCPWVDNYYGTGIFRAFGTSMSGAYNKQVDQSHETIQEDFYIPTIRDARSLDGFAFSRDGGLYDVRPDPKCWNPPVTVRQVLDEVPGVIVSGIQKGWKITSGFVVSVTDSVGGKIQQVIGMREMSNASISADVTIPSGAAYLRFSLRFVNKGDGDWLSLSFNDMLLFSMLGTDFGASDYLEVLLPVNALQGLAGRLVATLNSVGDKNAEVRLGTISFESQILDTIPPTTRATASPSPNANGWNNTNVTINLNATDNPGGTEVKDLSFTLSGASTGGSVVAGNSAAVTINIEGITTLTYFARDNASNQESAKTLTVKIDRTPPVITVSANPPTLWPPNGKMVPVIISGKITDALSGVNASTASYVVNDEYKQVQPQGNVALKPDGSYSFTIQLEASRNGNDQNGRQYIITIGAQDNAGNAGSATTSVIVPHDQGK
jgi:pimeloyl-ACP methyl ester carboxylesterase